MDPLPIARLQFATTTSLHFLFVLLTLGLVTMVAIMQTRATLRGGEQPHRMTTFWGRLYVVNYALGIVTGIVLEFQFGMTWTGLSAFAGDVFGAPLAIETLVAFFLESTFLGVWIFGRGRMNKWLHLTVLWLVTLTAYASALFIMVANSFLQNPVGSRMENGVLRLDDFGTLFANPALTASLPHVIGAALLTGGFFVTGVSAYHFLKGTSEIDFFRRSLRIGVVTSLIGSVLVVQAGFAQFAEVAGYQPDKFTDSVAVGLPLGMMINVGFFAFFAALIGTLLLFRDRLLRARPLLVLMVPGIAVPFIAAILGWLVREIGRQPWLVWGKLRTADAVADVSGGQILFSFIAFTLLFVVLAIADGVLLARIAKRGPAVAAAETELPVLSGV
ncbi:cytochrome ubiquinol oxidase subunit I [Amycolatopsis rubida]|uniref:Cytochrome ubiquinol oxidase subunit I n=1 Tax=Amycolatopsis rubida TaxID=112413 RepID=A0ABX0BP01_9PSEU|nr:MULTISPECIES: cytochrome ubiquinol oxidase subunit I [Amycolatopsis]MYW92349.1 cytochrome ubiquinol oxidase subunit I [Amycolatopsis rubida]NEC57337.1 cytochrome ubiquinol oxidase subunit I [Amycolatopsis rubida]OAP23786.1 Cytochrome bd-I ubiquinol oxidase subunit 1 [Amycolatopsis sp. M39]